ncbi:cation:proton antiporter regulatory subunit [Geosporobacter ferrireducens]|uniref:cation:proton antiporter regulatory subunit n=1 Tax=Geosporobacter ferrireducens TaxID=1424294 RepID=UPI0009F6D899|nr:TrkA C-terminal domain-containing protein [Geosporobacter ferrireducens]
MGILYGLTIILFLLLIVEILAIALKVTGLDMDKARFQVISIITNTGFTTRESELITQHPTRRRIAQILMLISYVGTATLIAFILNILNILSRGEGFLYLVFGVASVILLILFLSRNRWILRRIERYIEKQLKKKMDRNNKRRTVEEVLKLNGEYGVAEFIIEDSSGLVGTVLEESDLKRRYIQVLNIDRGSHIIHFPNSKFVFQQGDKVVVYGQLENIKALILEQISDHIGA